MLPFMKGTFEKKPSHLGKPITMLKNFAHICVRLYNKDAKQKNPYKILWQDIKFIFSLPK